MSERQRLPEAVGLVRGRVPGPPPRPKSTERFAQVPTPVPPTSGETPASSGDEMSQPTRRSRPKASETSTGGMSKTSISLPSNLVASLRERLQADPAVTQIQFILEAVERNATRLKELIDADRPRANDQELFAGVRRGRRAAGERAVVSFSITSADLKVLDMLVKEAGALNRSQLIRVALQAQLAD